jgi:hypothetical protein
VDVPGSDTVPAPNALFGLPLRVGTTNARLRIRRSFLWKKPVFTDISNIYNPLIHGRKDNVFTSGSTPPYRCIHFLCSFGVLCL